MKAMDLNGLLEGRHIDPKRVLVLRHRPWEPQLNKVLPWLAAERPEVFNAYQQTQGEKLERAMHRIEGNGYVASFIGQEAGKAVFVGLYSIGGSTPLTCDELRNIPANVELLKHGMGEFSANEKRASILWFALSLTDFYADWKGKLIVRWPPPERSWWRRAHRNEFSVHAILENSALAGAMSEWDKIDLTWEELRVLPACWRSALSQWRGVYYIFDTSDGKGYVGAAYGKDNLLGRWQEYAASGHGGNCLLRKRERKNFHFTILQRVSPDMDGDEVIQVENSWKQRLHTRQPHGLNDN